MSISNYLNSTTTTPFQLSVLFREGLAMGNKVGAKTKAEKKHKKRLDRILKKREKLKRRKRSGR